MTPKEALEGIKQAIAEHLHKQTGVSVEKHFEYLQYDTEIEVVTNALNELEELKKDVARFMVLLNIYLTDTQTIEEMHERWALEKKLSKVGKL